MQHEMLFMDQIKMLNIVSMENRPRKTMGTFSNFKKKNKKKKEEKIIAPKDTNRR